MNKHQLIPCPSCGELFECKLGSPLVCHCSDTRLSRYQVAYLAEKWDGCLCHKCLAELVENWDSISDVAKELVMLE